MNEESKADALQDSDLAAVERLAESYEQITSELSKVIVGQTRVIEELLIGMFAGGHALVVGVPGLAKTLVVRTLAQTLQLSFSRIQFTPDLMPSDITGTDVLDEDRSTGERQFRFLKGAVFANVILADEINRTPPKTQAALLEAMQEHQVTAGGQRHPLPQPFFVLATQNPIEHEGTYPLPEAQLDRFMFEILVDYPEEDEEFAIIRRTTSEITHDVQSVLTCDDIVELQRIVRRVPVADHVIRYAMQLSRLTRKDHPDAPQFVRDYLSWGAGPRASQFLILGAKARAMLHGQPYVSCDDVRAVALPTLRHRLITNFTAEAEGITAGDIVTQLIDTIPSDPSTRASDRLPKVFRSAGDR